VSCRHGRAALKQPAASVEGVLDSAPRLTLVALGNQSGVGACHDRWVNVFCSLRRIAYCQRWDGRPTALSPATG